MPGLFYHLDVEGHAPAGDQGLDCGVAAVFTCSNSCGTSCEANGFGVSQEFIFVQRDSIHG